MCTRIKIEQFIFEATSDGMRLIQSRQDRWNLERSYGIMLAFIGYSLHVMYVYVCVRPSVFQFYNLYLKMQLY